MSYPYGYDQSGSWSHDNFYYGGNLGGRSGGRGANVGRGSDRGTYYDSLNPNEYYTNGGSYADSKSRDIHSDGREFYYGNIDHEYDRRRPSIATHRDHHDHQSSRGPNYRSGSSGHYESRSNVASSSYQQSERSGSYYSYNGGQQPYFYQSSFSHSFYDNYGGDSYYSNSSYNGGNSWNTNTQQLSERPFGRSKLEKPRLADSPTKQRLYSFGNNKRKAIIGNTKSETVKASTTGEKNTGSVINKPEDTVLQNPDKIKDQAIEQMLKLTNAMLEHKISVALLALNLKLGDDRDVKDKENTAPPPTNGQKVTLSNAETPRSQKLDVKSSLSGADNQKIELPNDIKTVVSQLKRTIPESSSSTKKPKLSKSQEVFDQPPRLKPPQKSQDYFEYPMIEPRSGAETPGRRIDSITPQKSHDIHSDRSSGDAARRASSVKEIRTPKDSHHDPLRDSARETRVDSFRAELRDTPRNDNNRDSLRESVRDSNLDIIRASPRDFPPLRDPPRDRSSRDFNRGDSSRPSYRSGHGNEQDYYNYGASEGFQPGGPDAQYDYYQRSQSHDPQWAYDNNSEYSRGRQYSQTQHNQDRYSYYSYPSYSDHYSTQSGSDRGYFRSSNGEYNGRSVSNASSSPAEGRNTNYDREYWGNDGGRTSHSGKQGSGGNGFAKKGPPPLRTPR